MTFTIRQNLTIDEIVELAKLAKDAPGAYRVGQLGTNDFRLVEDEPRNALMFEVGAISRGSCGQAHYLLYFMQHWFDIRSRHFGSIEVCFYRFPPRMEAYRKQIEDCYRQAARVHGFTKGFIADARIFDPAFRPDDCFQNQAD